jgi:hypothetical protein
MDLRNQMPVKAGRRENDSDNQCILHWPTQMVISNWRRLEFLTERKAEPRLKDLGSVIVNKPISIGF